jgi:hypothetical protein
MQEMKTILAAIALLMISSGIFAIEPVTDVKSNAVTAIEGFVCDRLSGESLTGVKVKLEGSEIVQYTDFDGKFRIENLKPGNYTIRVEYISYDSEKIETPSVANDPGLPLTIRLQPSTVKVSAGIN